MSRNLPYLLALVLASCSSEAARDPLPDVLRDAGIVDLQIGALEGADPYVFTRISGLSADPEGRVFVADHQTSEVRVFDPDGGFLFVLNREGSGPGELSEPCCLAWSPDGLLWIRDGNNHRYNAYDVGPKAARFVEQRRMAHSDLNFWARTTFDTQGYLVDVGHRTSSDGLRETVRFHVDDSGVVTSEDIIPAVDPEEIGQHAVSREGVTFYLYQPFGPRQLIAHGPNGYWSEGISSTYEITVHHGDTRGPVLRRAIEAPTLSPREVEQGTSQMKRSADRAGIRVGTLPFEVPARKPPIRNVMFDARGRIWIERNMPDDSSRVADIWTPEGELEREFEWPADVRLSPPSWLGEDYALGVRQDSLGINYVVRVQY